MDGSHGSRRDTGSLPEPSLWWGWYQNPVIVSMALRAMLAGSHCDGVGGFSISSKPRRVSAPHTSLLFSCHCFDSIRHCVKSEEEEPRSSCYLIVVMARRALEQRYTWKVGVARCWCVANARDHGELILCWKASSLHALSLAWVI